MFTMLIGLLLFWRWYIWTKHHLIISCRESLVHCECEGVDGLFRRECIAVTLDIMSQCKIASTVELDDVRSVLLRLVVSVEGGQDTQEVAQISTSETDRTHDITQSDEENYREPPQQPPRNNGPVSSSPTSATDKLCWPPSSKLGRTALTPQRVLSTVS